MSETMWAAVYSPEGAPEVLPATRPVPAAGEVLIRVLAAAMPPCMGTPGAGEGAGGGIVGMVEQADASGEHLSGNIVVLATGEGTKAVPPATPGTAPAERPYVLAEYLLAAASQVIALPPHRPPQEGVLLDAAVQALRGVRRANVQIGDAVAVLGTQLSAMLAAQWVRIAGAYDVFVCEQDVRGLALARALWLGELCDTADRDPVARVLERTEGMGVSVAIVDAGTGQGMDRAVAMLRHGGTLLVSHQGCAAPVLPADVASMAAQRDIRVVTYRAQGACLAPRADWEIAISTWASGRLAVRGLITRTIALTDLIAAAGESGLNAGSSDWPAVVLAPELAVH